MIFAALLRGMAATGNSIDPRSGSIAIDCLETGMWRNPLPESLDVSHGALKITTASQKVHWLTAA